MDIPHGHTLRGGPLEAESAVAQSSAPRKPSQLGRSHGDDSGSGGIDGIGGGGGCGELVGGGSGTSVGDVDGGGGGDCGGRASVLGSHLHVFRPTDVQRGHVIGQGSFGTVQLGSLRGTRVAVKRLRARGARARDEVLAEAAVMARVGYHDHVVPLWGVIVHDDDGDGGCVELVTRYLPRGSVRDILDTAARDDMPAPAWSQRLLWAAQAAAGLLHLHAERVVHRDIAARNLLIGADGSLHVADFGFARTLARTADPATTLSVEGPVKWESPETLARREYSEASDAYAFGVTMFELAGGTPWEGLCNQDAAAAVCRGERPALPDAARLCGVGEGACAYHVVTLDTRVLS